MTSTGAFLVWVIVLAFAVLIWFTLLHAVLIVRMP